jgi:hypothetical protein
MPVTMDSCLFNLTVDELRSYSSVLTNEKVPTVKANMVPFIESRIKGSITQLWNRLEDIEKRAVAEAVFTKDGCFDSLSFEAKYDELPKLQGYSYRESLPLISLFLYYDRDSGSFFVPSDLRKILSELIEAPKPFVLESFVELPPLLDRTDEHYQWQEGDEGTTVITNHGIYKYPRKQPTVTVSSTKLDLVVRSMELTAQQDLHTALRLVAKGRIAVSDKTHRVSASSASELAELLQDGDFYESPPKKNKWESEIGPIRAFAWPLLLQAGKLAELQGKKLAVTPAGLKALNEPAAEALKVLWERWLQSSLLDEFQRIDAIKGQTGKGAAGMTPVPARRRVIATALAKCPINEWVKFDDFSRFMRAAGFHFEVSRWTAALYTGDQKYGSLEYDNRDDWSILEARYLRCFLFEYAATLGLIDVAYTHPKEAKCDFGMLFDLGDGVDFLSRYDGLVYFRLTVFGAYCLGLTSKYSAKRTSVLKLSALPSLQITVSDKNLPPQVTMLLDTYADEEKPNVWRLNRSCSESSSWTCVGHISIPAAEGDSVTELDCAKNSQTERNLVGSGTKTAADDSIRIAGKSKNLASVAPLYNSPRLSLVDVRSVASIGYRIQGTQVP